MRTAGFAVRRNADGCAGRVPARGATGLECRLRGRRGAVCAGRAGAGNLYISMTHNDCARRRFATLSVFSLPFLFLSPR